MYMYICEYVYIHLYVYMYVYAHVYVQTDRQGTKKCATQKLKGFFHGLSQNAFQEFGGKFWRVFRLVRFAQLFVLVIFEHFITFRVEFLKFDLDVLNVYRGCKEREPEMNIYIHIYTHVYVRMHVLHIYTGTSRLHAEASESRAYI